MSKKIVMEPFGMVPRGLIRDDRISKIAIRVYTALASFQGNNEEAWPGIKAIAEWIGASERSVKKGLKDLRDTGWIESFRRFGKSNRYRVYNAGIREGEDSGPDSGEDSGPDSGEDKGDNVQDQVEDQKKITRADSKNESALPFQTDFEEFWKIYPRHKQKTAAQRKYIATRRKGATAERLIRAARAYAKETASTEERFIKLGSTFLGPDEHWREYDIQQVARRCRACSRPVSDAENLLCDDCHNRGLTEEWARERKRQYDENMAGAVNNRRDLREKLGILRAGTDG